MSESPATVTFRFSKASDYRLIPVNCVWGGRTPRGDILVHLCHENQALPETVTNTMTSEGTLGNEVSRDPNNLIDRTVLVGMVLNADQADSIGRWLVERAAEIRPPAEEKTGDGHAEASTAH